MHSMKGKGRRVSILLLGVPENLLCEAVRESPRLKANILRFQPRRPSENQPQEVLAAFLRRQKAIIFTPDSLVVLRMLYLRALSLAPLNIQPPYSRIMRPHGED